MSAFDLCAVVIFAVVETAPGKRPPLVQGVYLLVQDKGRLRVRFVPVTTGVTGTTDIEVLTGLKEGDEIVTGRYRILRALKSGTVVKRDNTVEANTSGDDKS